MFNQYVPRKSKRRSRPQAQPLAAAPLAVRRAPDDTPHATPSAPRQTIRQQWPALNEPDCPLELHALVGHRISQYNEYTKLYAKLRDTQTLEECADVAGQLLAAYRDNRLCTRELDYYQRHRRLLGRHPLLGMWKQLEGLRSKTVAQLYREREQTKDNIWRAESEIKKGDKPHLDEQRRKRIEAYRLKLVEINRLLGEA